MTNEKDENKVSAFKIARRIACSGGLLLIVLAPLLWGLLPLGYTYIKQDPDIKANPTFIVFMRMFCSFVLTAVFGFICFLVLREKKKLLKNMWCNLKTSWVFLILLSLCYFFARFVEMKCILGFTYGNEESANNVCAIQVQHPYLAQGIDIEGVIKDLDGMTNGLNEVQLMDINLLKHEVTTNYALAQTAYLARNKESILSTNSLSKLEGLTNCVSKEKIEGVKKKLTPNGCIVKTATNGLQEFGYFMGLLLSLILVVKNHKVYGFLSKCSEKLKFEKISKKFEKQKGNPISFLGGLSMLITLFLIIASGVLNLAAREPLYAWSGIWEMLGWAFLVAILTSFAADFKGASSLCDGIDDGTENETEEVDKNSAAIFSSFVVNAMMSLFAAFLAFCCWCRTELHENCGLPDNCSLLDKFPQLWGAFFADGGRCVWFLVVIVFLCSCVAPVCMLYGTQKHDNLLKKANLDKYGISGKDWMQILGACEPLFVVLVGLLVLSAIGLGCSSWESVLSSKNPFVSLCTILLSVFTVAIIIVLRLMETWAEKNSVLRDYVFTQVRGSSRGIPDRKKDETMLVFEKKVLEYCYKHEVGDSAEICQIITSPNATPPCENCFIFKQLKKIVLAECAEKARQRAEKLTWLKLYNKRDALSDSGCKLEAKIIDKEIRNHQAVIAANKDASNKFHGQKDKSFYFVIEGCDKYFTQDDPFTHDVLSAIFDWLQIEQLTRGNYIQIDSFSYLFKGYCDQDNPWKNDKNALKNIACSGYNDATPFVLMVEPSKTVCRGDVALGVIKSLNEFLERIKVAVDAHELSGLVYAVVDEELDKMRKNDIPKK